MRRFARPILTLLAAAVLLAQAPRASAQFVNIQPLLGPFDEEGFKARLDGSLSWWTGTRDFLMVTGGGVLRYQFGLQRVLLAGDAVYGMTNGEVFRERYSGHLRYQWSISELITLEAFGQAFTASDLRLSMRGLGGVGPRFELISGPAVSLAVAADYMFEHEEHSTLTEDDGTGTGNQVPVGDSGLVTNHHRLSAYVNGRLVLTPLLTLMHTTYFQPRFDAFIDDFRIYSETALEVALTDLLKLTLSFSVRYDSDPPVAVDDVDTIMKAGLAFTL